MKMVPAFQKRYNIDKMNTVFLTDGCSDGGERIVATDPNSEEKQRVLETVGGVEEVVKKVYILKKFIMILIN